MNNEIKFLPPFKRMCMSIGTLPSSFYASMSYYESMVWLYEYLKNEVIPVVNNNSEVVEELQTAFNTLETYINDYFSNLDVQEEINKKLDEMAEDGTMTNLIKDYIDPIFDAYTEQADETYQTFTSGVNTSITTMQDSITAMRSDIAEIDTKVENAVSGSPLVASSTSGMTETDRVYVNTTDGKWYYYDGDSWEIGGTYQATQVDFDNSLTEFEESTDAGLIGNYTRNFENYFFDLSSKSLVPAVNAFEYGSINASGQEESSTTRARTSDYITLDPNYNYYIMANSNYFLFSIFQYDSNYNFVSVMWNIHESRIWEPLGSCKYIKILIREADKTGTGIDSTTILDKYNEFNFGIYKTTDIESYKWYKDSCDKDNLFNSVNANVLRDFNQGGFSNIGDYSQTSNYGRTRIWTEVTLKAGRYKILNENNSNYSYTYGFFNPDHTRIDAKTDWQTANSREVDVPEGGAIRIAIRKNNNAKIYPYEYGNSKIYVVEVGSLFRLSEFTTKTTKLIQDINEYTKIKVMSYNIGHFGYGVENGIALNIYDEKIANYKKFFASQDCDIVGIQEYYTYTDRTGTINTKSTLFDPLYKYSIINGNWTSIFSRHNILTSGTGTFVASGRGYTYATVKIDGKEIYLLDVHLHYLPLEPSVREQEFEEIQALIDEHTYYIVTGDFNVANTSEFENITVGAMANGGYLGWTLTYNYDQDYSNFPTPKSDSRYFDNILVSDNIVIANSQVLNVYNDLTSDHLPIIAELLVY